MKRRIPVGTVIARRTMVDAKSNARIVVSIGAPVFIGEGWDWACPYRISGLDKTLFGHAHGIDGIQALQVVGLAIRHALEKTKRNFSWLDQPYWQSGFPSLSMESEFRRSSATSNALLKMNTAASPRISRPGGSAPNPRTAHGRRAARPRATWTETH